MVKIYVDELGGEYYCLDETEMNTVTFLYQLQKSQLDSLEEQCKKEQEQIEEINGRLDAYKKRQDERDKKEQERITKSRESAVRRKLARQGYKLRKSRNGYSGDNLGGYMIVNVLHNSMEAGERYDLSLEDVEKWANE